MLLYCSLSCLHRDVVLRLRLAGENDAVRFVVRIESVLNRHLNLAGSHLHFADAAGADATREFDSDAKFFGELEDGLIDMNFGELVALRKCDKRAGRASSWFGGGSGGGRARL